jgi:hypothetical protein
MVSRKRTCNPNLQPVPLERVGIREQRKGYMSSSPSFEKVGKCLYRNPSSGKYYALVKVRGEQIKRSLVTDNLPTARRKLKDFKRDQERVDPDAGRFSVEALCDRYFATIAHQAPKTIRRKAEIITRLKARWRAVAANKVKKSEIPRVAEFLRFRRGFLQPAS